MTKPTFIPTVRTTTLLDRVGPKRADHAFISAQLAAADARFLIMTDLKPVIVSSEDRKSGQLRWFGQGDIKSLELPTEHALFLGLDRKTSAPHFALAFSEHRARAAPGTLEMLRPAVDLRTLAMQGVLPSEDLSLAGQARALAAWHENAHHCSKCGGTNQVKDGGWKRKCWACGLEHFPRTDPVVIMLAVSRDRCLLGRQSRFVQGMWSCLAGFVEPGESIEEAARRETLEEAGIRCGRVRYFASQPWPFPSSLMIGCHAEAISHDITVDREELEDARWFSRDEAAAMLMRRHPEGLGTPPPVAIAHHIIRAWVEKGPDVFA